MSDEQKDESSFQWPWQTHPDEWRKMGYHLAAIDRIDEESARKQERKALRNQFAESAMKAMTSGVNWGGFTRGEARQRVVACIAADAFALADAMLAESEKGLQP